MEKFRQIIAILMGTKQSVTFGLQHALDIFRKTKGRYDGDESKAVPFAILATAQALGAEVMIYEEGSMEIAKIQSAIAEREAGLKNYSAHIQQTVAELLEQVKHSEIDLEQFKERAEKAIQGLGARQEEVEATLTFFTV